MKKITTLMLTILLPAICAVQAGEEAAVLPPEVFLQELRRPLRQDVWGEITGRIQHVDAEGKNLEGELRVRITFTSTSMHAQLVLNNQNVYAFEQQHKPQEKVTSALSMPEKEVAPGLFSFGLEPEDLTFSFLYWDFLEELPAQKSRLRDCRVMKLAHPHGTGTVEVWFDAAMGFPMAAFWYHQNQEKPWRALEMKGAKRHENGLWFVKEMRLEGENWKTRVLFDFASLKEVGNK
jgi:hypothetical protein